MQTICEARPPVDTTSAGARVGSITYSSRANAAPTWSDLDALTRSAQQRNRAAGLTGVLLYEGGRFLQCIEGPPDALEPVWDSIRADDRHRDVEVLAMDVRDHRLFAGWDMRWLRKGEQDGDPGPGLAFLEPADVVAPFADLVLREDAAAILTALDARHASTGLAELLDHVLEPVARALGDAWLRDDLDDLTLTAALGKLHAVVHARGRREAWGAPVARRLLSVTPAGERHMLGAVAVAELHRNAGWEVDVAFAAGEADILGRVAAGAYDRVDVATSDAVERAETLDRADTLASRIRGASRRGDVAVSFGGRAFWAARSRWSPGQVAAYRTSAAALRLGPPRSLGLERLAASVQGLRPEASPAFAHV